MNIFKSTKGLSRSNRGARLSKRGKKKGKATYWAKTNGVNAKTISSSVTKNNKVASNNANGNGNGNGNLNGNANGNANGNLNANGNINYVDNKVDNNVDNKVENRVETDVETKVETEIEVDIKVDLDLSTLPEDNDVIDFEEMKIEYIEDSVAQVDAVVQETGEGGNNFNLDQINNMADNDFQDRIWTIGLNYKPIPQVVLKADYRDWNPVTGVRADTVDLGIGFIF